MKDVIALYIFALAIKLLAFLLTGFYAILGDVFHSVTDIAMLLVLLAASTFAARSGDLSHPFGHGMAKNVASLIVATSFVTILAFELLREGIAKVLNPSTAGDIETAVALEAAVLGILILAAVIAYRRRGIIHRTVFLESVNDSLSTVAAIAGVALSAINPVFDGVAAMIIAAMIVYNSARLIRENARFLLGLSPPDSFYDRVEEVCTGIEDVKGVHDMVGVYIGEDSVHLDIHVTVDGSMSVERADKLAERIVEELKREIPEIKHVTVHFCPHHGEKRRIY